MTSVSCDLAQELRDAQCPGGRRARRPSRRRGSGPALDLAGRSECVCVVGRALCSCRVRHATCKRTRCLRVCVRRWRPVRVSCDVSLKHAERGEGILIGADLNVRWAGLAVDDGAEERDADVGFVVRASLPGASRGCRTVPIALMCPQLSPAAVQTSTWIRGPG